MALQNIITTHIQHNGPIPFKEFMEMALYFPGYGYYNAIQDRIGTKGDYYTSPHLTPVFGALIGRQIEEMWHNTGRQTFTVVEYGAGTGKMCRDILDYLKTNPNLYKRLRYYIIEKSPAMRKIEQSHLCEKVIWIDTISELKPFTGCVLSNELLDNFAVHQVVMKDGLKEVFIGYGAGGFIEMLLPAAPQVTKYVQEMEVTVQEGCRAEVNLQAREWIREIAAVLQKGYLLTIDYGGLSPELYCPDRPNGTLTCFKQHRPDSNPYENIGEKDITSHVNFSALCRFGQQFGLATCGYTTQADFLLNLGFEKFIKACREQNCLDPATARTLHSMLIFDMGLKFKVLIQSKGNPGRKLSGLETACIIESAFRTA